MSNHFAAQRLSACEFINKLEVRLAIAVLVLMLGVPLASAQEHAAPAKPTTPQGQVDAPEHAEEHGGEHGLSALVWPTLNFAILVGGLWWFFKQPIATYLGDRHDSIRKDLVEAAAVKASAAEQLAEIDRKLQALPGELDALKHRGAEEIAAEEQRIAGLASAERERLLEQTRREIELQVRLAKRELVEHAANLAVQLASDRIEQTITPADQERLVDRYLDELPDSAQRADRRGQGAR